MCVSWTCGTSPLHRIRATDWPTVPNPRSATRAGVAEGVEGIESMADSLESRVMTVHGPGNWRPESRAYLYPVSVSGFFRSLLLDFEQEPQKFSHFVAF